MGRDREEQNRVLGFPLGRGQPRSYGTGPEPPGVPERMTSHGAESQRVLGFPVGWFRPSGRDVLAMLAHPVREYRRRRARG